MNESSDGNYIVVSVMYRSRLLVILDDFYYELFVATKMLLDCTVVGVIHGPVA